MPAIRGQFEAVREIGGVVLELMDVGSTPASYDCPQTADGRLRLEEDEGYWQTFTEMRTVLEGYGDPEITDPDVPEEESILQTARVIEVGRAIDENVAWTIEVVYYAHGMTAIKARVVVDGVERLVLEPYLNPSEEGAYELTPVDVGRMVARAEVVLLAAHLGSSAETLDYWMIDGLSPGLRLTQEAWGDVRGVSRQAVNENVAAARTKLEEN